MIIWLFGQPGSGKTTIALELLKRMKDKKQWVHIDGDEVRLLFNNKDYSRTGRINNGYFVISLCEFLQKQDFNIVVSIVTPYTEIRTAATQCLKDIMLVELVYTTDRGKNQYKVDDYEKGQNGANNLSINTHMTVEECINMILARLCNLG